MGMLGKSDKTKDGYNTGAFYINRFLTAYQYPPLEQLTDEAVRDYHLKNMLEGIGHYISSTNFSKERGSGYVGPSAKLTYFKAAKEVLKSKFPNHELWSSPLDSWWTGPNGMLKQFEKAADRHKQQDDNLIEERKSEPLYREIPEEENGMIRSKLGLDIVVDAKSNRRVAS